MLPDLVGVARLVHGDVDRPWPRIDARVLDCHRVVDLPRAHHRPALDHVRRIAVEVA